jgi:cysteinyl-tRNA synthetase
MSKSTGLLFYAEDIAARHDPEVVRYYLLSTHYRSPIEFSEERLTEAGVAYQRLRLPLERAEVWSGERSEDGLGGALKHAADAVEQRFTEAMDDDFNSAKAVGHLFDFAREINRAFDDGAAGEARAAARRLFGLGQILGLFWKAPSAEAWPAEVLELVAAREAARKSRNWKEADELRGRLLEKGVLVEDGSAGPRLKRRS